MTLVDLTMRFGVPLLPLLAHDGPGSTWQSMLVVAAVVLGITVLAAAFGRFLIERPSDLVVPLAAAAIASSLAPLGSAWLSDFIGWGLPLAVVSLSALLLAAFTPLELRLPAPLPMGAIALTVVAIVTLYRTLTAALHPPAELLPLADDSEIAILSPADKGTVDATTAEAVVEVTGGTIGPGWLEEAQIPDLEDPEEAGMVTAAIREVEADGTTGQQQRIELDFSSECPLTDLCNEVTFTLPVEPGRTYELTVDFNRGDGMPLAPMVRDRVEFTAN